MNDRGWREKVRAELALLPADYASSVEQINSLRIAFHEELAKCLAPKISNEIQKRPQSNLEDKKRLASWINAETRKLGLSVASPKTGKPATMVAGYRDDAEKTNRFGFLTTEGGRRRQVMAYELSDITLCPDPVRHEGAANRYQKNNGDMGRG